MQYVFSAYRVVQARAKGQRMTQILVNLYFRFERQGEQPRMKSFVKYRFHKPNPLLKRVHLYLHMRNKSLLYRKNKQKIALSMKCSLTFCGEYM